MPETNHRTGITLSPTAFMLVLSAVAAVLVVTRILNHQAGPPAPEVMISELCAHNGSGIRDQDGNRSDWIELHNAGTQSVNLEGWFLTDSFRALTRWRFPKVELGPDGYLVVFASKKDRRMPGAELHTNFKLKETGEYLALVMPDGVTVAHDYFPKYPRQRMNVSYGISAEPTGSSGLQGTVQERCYFQVPTPGGPNRGDLLALAKPPRFDRSSGFCESALDLSLSTPTRNATIYYTLDGSSPSPTNGAVFRRPLPIRTTTVLRALVTAPGMAASEIESRTYLFLPDILNQTGQSFPSTWGRQEEWTAPAHYAMSPEIVNDPAYHQRLLQGLRALPSISIITDLPNLFHPESGIYTHPMSNGVAWERPASVEMIDPAGEPAFRLNCGLRIQGGWNRRPEECPKHSLRLLFKKEYGPSHLQFPLFGTNGVADFQTLILRGGNNNSWLHWNFTERRQGDYLRDEWMRDSFLAMGYPSARGRFVHVYLNGLYWGIYNLCERPSAPFVAANEGGSRTDYDSQKAGKILAGDKTAWNTLMAAANAGLAGDPAYRAFQDLVDLPELTDYLILNFYGGNADWDRSSNWYAARPRKPGGKYQFFVWDGERSLEGVDVNSLDFDDDESPPRLFHKLSENPEFRLFFADRVQRLLFQDGPLSPQPAARRYRALAEGIETAIVAESARWGSYRRDVHPYKVAPFEFYKPDEHWRPEVHRLLTQYFSQRPAALIGQLRERGLYPRIPAPTAEIKQGLLYLDTNAATIYYTLDGADPRLPAGHIAPQAAPYAHPIPISPRHKIKARATTGPAEALEWSTLLEF